MVWAELAVVLTFAGHAASVYMPHTKWCFRCSEPVRWKNPGYLASCVSQTCLATVLSWGMQWQLHFLCIRLLLQFVLEAVWQDSTVESLSVSGQNTAVEIRQLWHARRHEWGGQSWKQPCLLQYLHFGKGKQRSIQAIRYAYLLSTVVNHDHKQLIACT